MSIEAVLRRLADLDTTRPLEGAKSGVLLSAYKEAWDAGDTEVMGAIESEWMDRGRELA